MSKHAQCDIYWPCDDAQLLYININITLDSCLVNNRPGQAINVDVITLNEPHPRINGWNLVHMHDLRSAGYLLLDSSCTDKRRKFVYCELFVGSMV